MAALWVFYSAALIVIHTTLSKTVRTAILLQKTSEELLAEIERDQVQLTETNGQLAVSIEQLTHQATHDALTGLLNRRGMFESLDALIGETATQPVGVLFLDLDRFKAINDTLGHRGGDHFLRIVVRSHRTMHQSHRGRRPHRRRRVRRRIARRRRADDGRCRPPVARPARSSDSRGGSRAAVIGQHRHRPRSHTWRQRRRSVGQRQRRPVPGEDIRSQQSRFISTPSWPARTRTGSISNCDCDGQSTTATSFRSSSPSSMPAAA